VKERRYDTGRSRRKKQGRETVIAKGQNMGEI
jgi:hypothetical protein